MIPQHDLGESADFGVPALRKRLLRRRRVECAGGIGDMGDLGIARSAGGNEWRRTQGSERGGGK